MLSVAALIAFVHAAPALNKQGARASGDDAHDGRDDDTHGETVELSGYVFGGLFLWNPTYAARPSNSGLALGRFGVHADVDLFTRKLTVSYDENSFTDGDLASTVNPLYPSEQDHILGVITTWPLSSTLSIAGAVHGELDAPVVDVNAQFHRAHPEVPIGYTQSYADAFGKLAYDDGAFSAFAALGAFVWNETYAARPDNSGLAFLRVVGHGEAKLLPWLTGSLDANFFTDRDTGFVIPSEADVTLSAALHRDDVALTFVTELDTPLSSYPPNGPHPATSKPGVRQGYVAALLSAQFDWLIVR